MQKDAKDLLEKAISLDPNLAEAHFKLGQLNRSDQNLELAAENFANAVNLNPSFSLAECEYGKCLCDMGIRRGQKSFS